MKNPAAIFLTALSLMLFPFICFGYGGLTATALDVSWPYKHSTSNDPEDRHILEKRLGMPVRLRNPTHPSVSQGDTGYLPETDSAKAAREYVYKLPLNQLQHNGKDSQGQGTNKQGTSSQEQSSSQSSTGSTTSTSTSGNSATGTTTIQASLGSSTGPSRVTLSIIFPGLLRPRASPEMTSPGQEIDRVRITTGGQTFSAFLISESARNPGEYASDLYIIWFHGNYEFAIELVTYLAFKFSMHNIRWNILLPEYPGFNGEQGYPWRDNLIAMMEAWSQWFLNKGVPQDHVVTVGRSIGTAMATYWAARFKPAAVILDSPFENLMQVVNSKHRFLAWLGSWFYTDFLDLQQSMDLLTSPALVIARQQDNVIPESISAQYYLSLIKKGKSVEYLLLQESSHGDLTQGDSKEYFKKIGDFLEEQSPQQAREED